MNRLPLVSVGIPTYNRPRAVAEVVRSMLAQTYPSIEIIVTDDGDSSATREALGDALPKIQYHANPVRLGLYGNWNRSIELGRGELVAVYHDHDAYDPRIVERSVELFLKHPTVGLVHPAVQVVPENARAVSIVHDFAEVTRGRDFAERQVNIWSSFVAHGALMVRRELYERLGTFDGSLGFGADMELLIRLALHSDVGYVREVLYRHFLRRPGDAFFEFSWSRTQDTIRMRRANINNVYADDAHKRGRALRRLAFDVQLLLLKYVLWAKLHRRDDVVREGLGLMEREAWAPTRTAAQFLTSDAWPIAPLRSLAFAARHQVRQQSTSRS
jgi:glycosyltransferase involved in cell wall biosynthesis